MIYNCNTFGDCNIWYGILFILFILALLILMLRGFLAYGVFSAPVQLVCVSSFMFLFFLIMEDNVRTFGIPE
jgi:hypothetical protein